MNDFGAPARRAETENGDNEDGGNSAHLLLISPASTRSRSQYTTDRHTDIHFNTYRRCGFKRKCWQNFLEFETNRRLRLGLCRGAYGALKSLIGPLVFTCLQICFPLLHCLLYFARTLGDGRGRRGARSRLSLAREHAHALERLFGALFLSVGGGSDWRPALWSTG